QNLPEVIKKVRISSLAWYGYWEEVKNRKPQKVSGTKTGILTISVLFACRENGAIWRLSLIYIHAELSVQHFH
ncbi:hypothetical protein, partial [Yersinia artesiana]